MISLCCCWQEATPRRWARRRLSGRLLTLAGESDGLFAAPHGAAIPFGVMEAVLTQCGQAAEYDDLVTEIETAPLDAVDALRNAMQALIAGLSIPESLLDNVRARFEPSVTLAVRSSANGEDLEALAGAGLYESLVGVTLGQLADALKTVWASLWTRRAVFSRRQAGIPQRAIRMAVLLQETVEPEYAFILHTTDHQGAWEGAASIEMAAGLGETLASADQPGTPWRLRASHDGERVEPLACANFSYALHPSAEGQLKHQRIVYNQLALMADASALLELGARLGRLSAFLEEKLGGPQDVEGVVRDGTVTLVQTRPQQGVTA